jgi:uncharacterized membrane-anchored protein YhcB (DUF1043 family)
MAELDTRERGKKVESELGKNLERLDEDLEIMERHAAEMADVEDTIQEDMRKWDREHKDASLHSVPRPRKHLR